MKLKSLLLPYDVFTRHKIIAELAGKTASVLDVGGSLKELSQFLPSRIRLFTVDLIGGDVIYDGKNLPFKTGAVDTVVSIDTIEHIPQKTRQEFIKELARVAKRKLIIAAPLGTKAHIQSEKLELQSQKTRKEATGQYLQEHVKHGLPMMQEIKHWLKNYPHSQIIFSGDFRTAQLLFKLHQSQIKLPKLGRLWFESKKFISAIINLGLFPIEKQVPLSQTVNRFYLKINL